MCNRKGKIRAHDFCRAMAEPWPACQGKHLGKMPMLWKDVTAKSGPLPQHTAEEAFYSGSAHAGPAVAAAKRQGEGCTSSLPLLLASLTSEPLSS